MAAHPCAPELLAPAGSWACVKAAVENGADAIYFGLDRFNARMRAENFTVEDLPELMAFLHGRGVRGYLTLNTLVFPKELKAAAHYLRAVIAAGVDAAIVQDVGICRLIRHLSPDFPIHASTQMTITSAAGVAFAKEVGAQLVVLARECSLKDINRIQRSLAESTSSLPLETFVHGALCVAYSGQCLTSESLGGRSANRGECAQACRMAYELIADGQRVDLGDRAYLLSPQDLSGLPVIPDLMAAGISSLKIEGRLKTPEYVANVTRVYRQALDQAIEVLPASRPEMDHKLRAWPRSYEPTQDEQYRLDMAFSRGLSTGWFQGIDNQQLVHARFGKKRGAYVGRVSRILKSSRRDVPKLVVTTNLPIKPGDGVVIDTGHPDADQGGRLYGVDLRQGEAVLSFGRGDVDVSRVRAGDRIWKTSDPELDKATRQTFSGDQPRFKRPITITLSGRVGKPLTARADDLSGHQVEAVSEMALVLAENRPLTSERLHQQFSRLGNTPFVLSELDNQLEGEVMLPVSQLNQLRRSLVEQLMEMRSHPTSWQLNPHASHRDLLPSKPQAFEQSSPRLIPLVRTFAQLQAVIDCASELNIQTVYCELENPARYKEAVAQVVQANEQDDAIAPIELFAAPPRITKPSENYILDQVRRSGAHGYLVRNYDHLAYFKGDRCIGDFSLNIANPITASYFKERYGLERLTASYDLNVQQLSDLLESAPAGWFDITLHQHMPMFHMEHCVFCAFLSEGTDFTNCGRPCESHTVELRDRTGTHHILQADAGCRNTLYNGRAQTGAEFVPRLLDSGARHFRIDFLNESPSQLKAILRAYAQLLSGELDGTELWQSLNLSSQLGVTRGTLLRTSTEHRQKSSV